jgi:hypothetical protein
MRLLKTLMVFSLLMGAVSAKAATGHYAILSLGYTSASSIVYYNQTFTTNMVVARVDDTYARATNGRFNLTASWTAPGPLALSGDALQGVTVGTRVYVSDGIRTWATTLGGGQTSVYVDNTTMINGGIGFDLPDYSVFNNQVFYGWATGSIADDFLPASGNVHVGVDAIDEMTLTANPGYGSVTGSYWIGQYLVSDLSTYTPDGKLYGYAGVLGQLQTINEPFQSSQSITIDSRKPIFQSYGYTVMAGIKDQSSSFMFLSSESNNASAPSSYRASNNKARMDFSLNKTGCKVTARLMPANYLDNFAMPLSSRNIIARTMPTKVLGAMEKGGAIIWDGMDGIGNYVGDGTYPILLSVVDANNVSGADVVINIKVTTLQFKASVSLVPNFTRTDSNSTMAHLATINHMFEIYNDSGTSIRSSLEAMGWYNWVNGPVPMTDFGRYGEYRSFVFVMPKVFQYFGLKADGTADEKMITDFDPFKDSDADADFVANYGVESGNAPSWFDADLDLANGYLGQVGMCSSTASAIVPVLALNTHIDAGSVVDVGDGNKTNDWMFLGQPMQLAGGTSSEPTKLKRVSYTSIDGEIPSAPTTMWYRVEGQLCGLFFADIGNVPNSPDMMDPCQPLGTVPWFISRKKHALPSVDIQVLGDQRGLGMRVNEGLMELTINPADVRVVDSTPPVLVSSNPIQDSSIEPNTYNSSNPLWIKISEDNPQGFNLVSGSYNLQLSLLIGGKPTFVNGTVGIQGSVNGPWTLSFTPNQALTLGGKYTLTYLATSVGGTLAGDISFTINDTAKPVVSSIRVLPSAGGVPVVVYPQSGAVTVDNGLSQVWLELSMPFTSTNTINWSASSIDVIPVINGVDQAKVGLTRLDVIPNNGVVRFQLNTPVFSSGTYKVNVLAVSMNSNGDTFQGPENFSSPLFNIRANSNLVNIFQQDPYTSTQQNLALQMVKPITVQSRNGVVSAPENITAVRPGALPAEPSGYNYLQTNTGSFYTMQFNYGATGLRDLQFQSLSSTSINLYYYGSDLPIGVSQSALVVMGYSNGNWVPWALPGPASSQGSLDLNYFSYSLVSTDVFPDMLAVCYPGVARANVTVVPTPTPTPVSFMNTRSFNPNHANAIHRKAKIYFGTRQASEIEAKVYSSAGITVRTLGSQAGKGAGLTQSDFDPAYNLRQFYVEWDGMNDGNAVVKNGVYIVVVRARYADGTSETIKKTVALIK